MREQSNHPLARQAGGWLAVAAANGFVAVAAGAFGAHALSSRLEPDAMNVFELAARYQMYHALAMAAAAWRISLSPSRAASAAAWLLLAGMLIFSGSLYGLSLTGLKWLGAITPVGGTSLLVGWLLLGVAGLTAARRAQYATEEAGTPGS